MELSDLVFIDSTGYHYADFPTFLDFFTTKYKNIYGNDIYLGADSQDGQSVAIEAQAAFDAAALGAATYNSFSPVSAQGVGLSRVVKINGIRRESASNSTAELVIVGAAFTTLTNAIAIDVLNQKWSIPSPTVIPFSGTITVTAIAIDLGSIQALPNTITGIFTPTQGWQSVNNPAAATPGEPVESDGLLRARQKVSTALPSLTVFEGTVGAVENLPGVIQVKGYENPTASTDANGIPAHMISLVVLGGIDTDIASSIALKKTPGTGTFGTTSVPTVDKNGMPITINFYRPTNATIGVRVTLTPLSSWITSNETIIAAALASFISATPIGGNDLGAGNSGISFSQLFGVAYVPNSSAIGSFIIESIEISKNGGSLSEADINLLFNENAICDPLSNVSFVLL